MWQNRLKLCYGAQPRLLSRCLNPSHIDERNRRKAEAVLIEAVDEAEYLGARGIVFPAGRWQPGAEKQAGAQLFKTTCAVCDYAGVKGMSVELEIFNFNMDKAGFIGLAPYTSRFAADMRETHNNFGLLVDLSHLPAAYEGGRFAIRLLRPYVTQLHFNSAMAITGCGGYRDLYPRFGYPDSVSERPELLGYLSTLRKKGILDDTSPYVLSIEVTLRPGEDRMSVLAHTKRVFNQAWVMLDD